MMQSRFLKSADFAKELGKFHVYGSSVGPNLLENLERLRLVVPQFRVRYPAAVVRRLRCEINTYQYDTVPMSAPPEPDGESWSLAIEFENTLHKHNNSLAYGSVDHPLASFNADSKFAQFVEIPGGMPFVPWDQFKTDVSSRDYPYLQDDSFVRTFYSSWQLLLAVEVANIGMHVHCNLADGELTSLTEVYEWLPTVPHTTTCKPAIGFQEFKGNETVLNAIVYFAEEAQGALCAVTRNKSGRFLLEGAELERLRSLESNAAQTAKKKFNLDLEALVRTCSFIAEKWTEWNHIERPSVASAYKSFLSDAIKLTKLAEDKTFEELNSRIGRVGGWHEPILDVIWPDWEAKEKERLRKTLKSTTSKPGQRPVSESAIRQFTDYIVNENLQAFFWALNSFEEHAFQRGRHGTKAMQRDIQSLALTIEHLANTLVPPEGDLMLKFQQLWKSDAAVVMRIANNLPATTAACQGLRNGNTWSDFLTLTNTLRATGEEGEMAADLLVARFIRGAAHYQFPVKNPFELESAFATLLRAALRTFCTAKGLT